MNLKNGVPLETVSKMLGHTKISTTKENYADVDEEKIIEDTAGVQERFTLKKQKAEVNIAEANFLARQAI